MNNTKKPAKQNNNQKATKKAQKNKPVLSTDKTGFVTWFRHWRSGQIIRAKDYGYDAFPIRGRKK